MTGTLQVHSKKGNSRELKNTFLFCRKCTVHAKENDQLVLWLRQAGAILGLERPDRLTGGNPTGRCRPRHTPTRGKMNPFKTILLIEDNPSDAGITRRALRKAGLNYRMDVAVDGEDAIQYMFRANSNLSPLPSLILMGLASKVSGLEVLKQLRSDESTRHVPVVIFTDSKEEIDVAAAYCLGANSYVQKPVDFEQFVQIVRMVCSYWLHLNEVHPFGVQQKYRHERRVVPHRIGARAALPESERFSVETARAGWRSGEQWKVLSSEPSSWSPDSARPVRRIL